MSYIFATLFTLVLIGLVAWIFVNSEAKSIARFFKLIIPVSAIAIGIIATIAGRGQYGVPAILVGVVWWYSFVREKKA